MAVMVACVAACASSATEQHEYDDPFEGYNRAMFSFNYQVDKYVIKPVAEGYRAVTTPFIRERISSVIDNLKEPVSAGNHLLQADPEASVKSLSRFVINSTLGLVGMFDVAEGWGLPKDKTTFNETFANGVFLRDRSSFFPCWDRARRVLPPVWRLTLYLILFTGRLIRMPMCMTKLLGVMRLLRELPPVKPRWIFWMIWSVIPLTSMRPCVLHICKIRASLNALTMFQKTKTLMTSILALKTKTLLLMKWKPNSL